MGQAFLYGNGGANALNFKVIASVTEPTDPTENMIWVKTALAVSLWELSGVKGVPTWNANVGYTYIQIDAGAWSGDELWKTDTNFIAFKKSNIYTYLKLVGCVQNQDGTASGWKSMNAYIYKSGSWVQFSTEFTAGINVSAPAGSTITCTDGTTTLTAGDTNGGWYFVLQNAGNWTVTATSGSNSASQTVSITTSGQVEQVVLTYFDGYYYENGNEWSNVTGGWIAETKTYGTTGSTTIAPTLTKASDHMEFDLVRSDSGGYGATLRTQTAVDLTNVKTLYFDIDGQGTYKQYWLGAIPENGAEFAASIEKGSMSTFTISRSAYNVDVSSLSGKYWIAISIYSASSSTSALNIYNVYGE